MTALMKNPAKFVETAIEDETILMLLDTGDFFSLKGTGQAVWELINGQRDRNSIVAELGYQFDDPDGLLTADVDAFLAQLTDTGVLTGG